ncbi:MAG: hypothetical protein KFH87_01665 [Bacteroidetes bacterium]|nr:hypothetical protein [Bacteroidota bacterium]
MFERNIEETITHLRKDTIEDADSITSRQIFASSMPPSLKRMFEIDVENWVREEAERLPRSAHFLYDDDEVLSLFEQITTKAREYAVFSQAEYDATLEKSVKLLFNYICRPQWTLVKYLFTDREHAATEELLESMRIFWHYEYYQIILREYYEKKNISVINVDRFTELIARIDEEVMRNFDSRKTAHLSEPVFELFNEADSTGENTVPIEALSIFFDDKNLSTVVERLDALKQQEENITMHDLVMLVGDADFTLGMDISTIVNEQLTHMSGMKPERHATAGQDFSVPHIDVPAEDEKHHGDLGDEDDALDFVISDQEEGVVIQHEDHSFNNFGMDESTQQDEIDDEVFLPTQEGDEHPEGLDDRAEDTQEDTVSPQNEEDMTFAPDEEEEVNDENRDDGDDYLSASAPQASTHDELLDLDEEMGLIEEALMQDDEGRFIIEDNEIPDVNLDDEEEQNLHPGAPTGAEVISLDESDEFDLDADEEDPYAMTPGMDQPEDLTPSDDESSGDEVGTRRDDSSVEAEDDIDWEREAEEIDEMELEISGEDALPEKQPSEDDPFAVDASLKPAEELLGQLDLDDEPEPAEPATRRRDDIPVIEDIDDSSESDADSDLDGIPDEEEESVPAEEVISKYGDLNTMLSASEKKRYIRKLFKKNEEAFNKAMMVLNAKPTWRHASEYIDELFIKFDVDMYSRLAVKFTDDIYKRYANKG